VPIEALEQRRPVIVINSGGPAETVIEGVTGTKVKIREILKQAFRVFKK
jgi:glycosyltransferase involved in cell wall biosynthesis